ncbi:MAG TPA: pyrophosphatase PpaX, partial [Verrucomicrobiae bacterium]|nr:pyrophosphatase PpaX [Verrucomicrobiae bacterium]
MKFDCILFDLDGTLINTNDLIIKSFQHTIRVHMGRESDDKEFVPYFGEPLITMLERIAPGRGEELIKTYREFNLAKHDTLIAKFEGIVETLQELKDKGVTLGVVTSKLKPLALRGMELCGLQDMFEVIIACEDTTRHKPEPDPVLKALEILGRGKEGVLYVGDSTMDIMSAKRAGVKSAAVMWSALDRQSLLAVEPDIVVE